MNTTPPIVDSHPAWSQSLATGTPGITLLHIERARAGHAPWTAVQQWAATVTRDPIRTHHRASLYTGAPAVAFALHTAGQPAYQPALDTLDHAIRQIVARRLTAAAERVEHGRMPDLAEYDLISGLTGLGAYLHHRNTDHETLRDVLTYLVQVTRPVMVDGQEFPGWWTRNGPQDVLTPEWAGGHANLGMAHGIAGPLALLSTTMRHGTTVPGQPDAIQRICTWLDTWQHGSQPWWPATVSLAELRGLQPSGRHPHRPSWCYGTPGLARAMQLAGLALNDDARRQLAEDTLAACLTDTRQLGHLTDASLCHGWAGLALTAWRVAGDSPTPQRFTGQILRLLPHLDASTANEGLLEGSAGVHLVRHTTTRDPTPPPTWDACLLLAG